MYRNTDITQSMVLHVIRLLTLTCPTLVPQQVNTYNDTLTSQCKTSPSLPDERDPKEQMQNTLSSLGTQSDRALQELGPPTSFPLPIFSLYSELHRFMLGEGALNKHSWFLRIGFEIGRKKRQLQGKPKN